MHKSLQETFSSINWGRPRRGVPRSGPGSTVAHTEGVRTALPRLFHDYGIRRFVDAPCGDWHWMQHVDLSGVTYVGLDIVEEIVAQNVKRHARPGVSFAVQDIPSDPLPEADMIMCRDCLFHLKYWLRWAFFENFVASGTPYLLMTIHDVPENARLAGNGEFRFFNPCVAPFNFPEPLEQFDDSSSELDEEEKANPRKRRYMGLWTRDQVISVLADRQAS